MVPAANSTELLRFRRRGEPGMLSLPLAVNRRLVSALPKNPIILIPSRLAARRLPNKPLADIRHVGVRATAIFSELRPVMKGSGDPNSRVFRKRVLCGESLARIVHRLLFLVSND